MMEFSTRELLYAMGAPMELVGEAVPEADIAGVSIDSRTVREGDVFFAINGERVDGANFVEQAIAGGALCAVVEQGSWRNEWDTMPVIPVPDSVAALGKAARAYRAKFPGTVIAITGTSGKTTVKEMMLAVLAKKYRVHGTRGNFNNHIGLPLTIFGLGDQHQCAVLELGMSAPGEISYLADVARPNMGFILNIGPGHVEFFKSVEDIADAKTELLDALGPDHTAVLNGDDPLLRDREKRCRSNLLWFGREAASDFRAEDIRLDADGCAMFRVRVTEIHLQVPGVHNVYNALAAFTAGLLMDVSPDDAAEALRDFRAPDKRMQLLRYDGITWLNDAYNANPLSMRAAADVLKGMHCDGRKIAMLGDMLELGSVSDESHRSIGAEFARAGIDRLVCVGELAEKYRDGAVSAGFAADRIELFANAGEAADWIAGFAGPGDIVLVKGSRAVGMEKTILPLETT